jgi:hypothetical protein
MSTNGQLDRQRVIDALTIIRKEWDIASEGEPLEFVEGSVGFIIQDVVLAIGLSEDEQLAVLGQPIAI